MVKAKKISFFSSIVLIVASTIGAGIFFKNRELASMSHGDMMLVIYTWIVAIVGIVALGMALIEVTSAKNLQRGMLGWTKMFCPQWFHRATIKYQRYFFVPITLFSLCLYVTQTFVEAGWAIKNAWLVLGVSFVVFCFFMFMNLLSLKTAEVAQWFTTIVQLIPLFVLPIIALTNIGRPHSGPPVEPGSGLIGLTKWMVLLGGLPAIFFAYDGFYTVAELRHDLKSPNKMGKSLICGLIIISSIYLFLTISFNLGSSDGTHNGIELSPWVKTLFNIAIALGIMGIINGYSIASPRLYRSMIQHNEAKDVSWLHQLLFKNSQNERHQFISSWIYLFITTTLFFIFFGLIGIFTPTSSNLNGIYGEGVKLYELADLLLNYSSLLIFVVIATVILGALINRKNNKFEVKKIRFFKIYSIVAIAMFYFSLLFVIVSSIVNLTGLNGAEVIKELIKLSIFLGVLLAVTFPEIISFIKQLVVKFKTKRVL